MDQSARLARGGNQIIPAPSHMLRGGQAQYAIPQRIAQVMIEKQPAARLLTA